MTLITATTENNPQIIGGWWTYTNGNAWWSGVRLVAWISQNKTSRTTTLYFKWQRNQYNYWPFDNSTHVYSVIFNGQTRTSSFSLPSVQTNGVYDLTTVQSITVQYANDSTSFAGTLEAKGYITWENFDQSDISVSFPDIPLPAPDPDPEPVDPEPVEPDPPAPLVFDDNPRYYIYADGDLVYGAGIEGYEVLNPKVSLEVNKAGSLRFDIPVGSAMYNQLSKLKTTIEARQGNEVLFRGRLLNTKRSMMNTISCYCEGFFSWLVDIVFLPQPFNGQARDLLKTYLDRYNSRASSNRQIEYVYSDISAKITIKPKDHSNAWSEIKKNLIDGVGGYLVPYLTAEETGIQWLSTYGASTSQVIQFGENLLDFEEYIDASNVFTAVRPYGKENNGSRIGLSGSSAFVEDSDAIEMFGRIERTVFFDEIESEAALRTAAEEYLRTGIQNALTLSIKAVDLHLINADIERIRLGDAVRVVSFRHGIDAYFMCIKIDIDMAHPKNTVYTFGSTQRTISELTDTSYNKYIITEGA